MFAPRVLPRLWSLPALLTALLLTAGIASAQTTFWQEDFSDVSDWATFQTTILSDGNIGTITADVDYGNAETTEWSTGTFGCGPQSDWLHVECTAVTGHFKVNIMGTDYVQYTLLESLAPGTWDVDIQAVTGWSGWQAFKIVVWVEWATPGSASFDLMSVSSTADSWEEEFDPIQAGWRDDSTDPGFNAYLTDIPGAFALIEEAPGVDWGKVLSPVLTIDVDEAPTLTAVVDSDADMSNFLFGIQEEEGDYRFYCLGRGYEAGIFQYDYKAMLGWTGVHTFSIHVAVESQDVDGFAIIDRITLDCSDAPPIPEYACCFEQDETCFMMTHWNCLTAGGTPYDCDVCDWAGGLFTCPLWRVCCVGETCMITSEAACVAQAGEWHAALDSCDPNPCLPVPDDTDSWGSIKALYR